MAQLRQARNSVDIEGILSEAEFREGTGERGNWISATFKIEVSEDNVIPVYAFASERKKDGTPNKIYRSLRTAQEEFKSIAVHGKEGADRVRVRSASLGESSFWTKDENLITMWRVNSNFITRVDSPNGFSPAATFEVEGFVAKIIPETKQGEETGRLIVTLIVPIFGGRVDLIDFIVSNPKAVAFIESHYQRGDTVKFAGNIRINEVIERREEEVAFGDPIIREFTRTTRELIVTSGSEAYTDERAFDPNEIKEALAARQAYLESLKNKEKPKADTSKKNDFNFSFL